MQVHRKFETPEACIPDKTALRRVTTFGHEGCGAGHDPHACLGWVWQI